jgi:translation initiation factor IF-2
MAEKEIARVKHWYDKLGVAVLDLKGTLKSGDKIKVRHGEVEFDDTIGSMQIDHKDVTSAKKGDEVAVKLSAKAKEGCHIFKAA